MGAFAVLLAESRPEEEGERLEAFHGLAVRDGFLAFALSLMLLSLAGIPPLGGFTAKLFLFSTAIAGGSLPLVIIAILASLVGIYYYLRPISAMFFEEAPRSQGGTEESALSFLLIFSSFLLFYFGLFPGSLLSYFREVATQLIGHGQ
jgi:NADH-quinone oxidoreductase subunit N